MDDTRKRLIALSKRTPFSNLLQYVAYDASTCIYTLAGGNRGMIFEVTPYVFAGDDMAEQILTVLNKELLPDEAMISFTLWAGHDVKDFSKRNKIGRMQRFSSTGDREVDEILNELAEEHVSYITGHTGSPVEKRFGTIVRDMRAYVSVVIKTDEGSGRDISDDDQLEELHTEVEQGLAAAALNPRSIDPKGLIRLVGSIVNWSESPSWANPDIGYSPEQPIRKQICDIDHECVVNDSSFRLNERYVKVISAHAFPKRVTLSDSYSYLMAHKAREAKIKDNVLITTNIYLHNAKQSQSSIKRNRKWSKQQDVAPFNKFEPKLTDIARSFDLLFDSAVTGGDRPCSISFSVAMFGDSEEKVRRQASDAISHFRSLKYDMKEEILVALPVFCSMLPMNADPDGRIVDLLGRFRTCTTKQAARILPLCSEWKGVGHPVSTFIGKTGQLVGYNNFDNSTNYNILLMAESGSGKSVLANRMIADLLAHGGRAIIIDQGYSYLNACELFKGEFITFNEESCPNLNPFPLINDFSEEIDMLVGIIVAMANIKTSTQEGVFQSAMIKMILSEVWNERGHNSTIDDIADKCRGSNDRRISDIAVLLNSFTKNGEYGKYYYNHSKPVDFSKNRLIILELDDLKNKEHLSQVVVLQLILMANSYIYQKTANGDSSWTTMFIDEAWKFVASGSGRREENPVLEFILTAYRQFRKNNAAMAMITQSLNDVYQHAAGRAIAENAGNRLYLGQKVDSLEQMFDEKKIVLEHFWFDQLKSVRTEKGYFSEIFFDTSVAKGVGRLVLSPYSLLLFSTASDDRIAIRNERKRGWSIHQAAIRVLQSRGVAAYMNVEVGEPDGSADFDVIDVEDEQAVVGVVA
ncbi:TraC family protein [Thalassolituus marinus]|uniref:TraC family protein n=1 Tax=Thalassolituus marinus TaxID=671053 RepID=A0ABS7ZUG0_9GAMM|nr:TraC family protein [Thalassolituus marinus]MCA6065392.1 TraC family protein [Thalassolituus marinus]